MTKSTKGRARKLWIIFGIALVATGGVYFARFRDSAPPRIYKEHEVRRANLELSVRSTGSIQPENRLVVKPQIPGRIDEILVEEGQRVKAGQILAWMSSNDRAALVDMARSSSVEEQIRWQEIYKPSPIIAPLGGIVIAKQVERGQTVGTSDVVFVVSDRLIVLAQVDETDLAKIATGQSVEIQVDAYSERPVTGKVIRIAYESKQVNNVTIYEIRILPDKFPDFMRSGMTASVKFIQERHENILTVPVSFLSPPKAPEGSTSSGQKSANTTTATPKDYKLNSGSKFQVLVKSDNPDVEPERRIVTIGVNNGKFVEITEGLAEGTTILQSDANGEESKKSANPFSPFSAPRGGRR